MPTKLLYVALAIFAGAPAFAADPTCAQTPAKDFCVGDEVYAPNTKGFFVPGKIKSISANERAVLDDGRELSASTLVGLGREDCLRAREKPLPPTEQGLDPAVTSGYMNNYRPNDLKACPGDRIKDDVNGGVVLGFFGDGAVLLAGPGVPPRRVEKDAFKKGAELNPLDEKRDLFEAVRGLTQIKKILALTEGVAPCEASPPALSAPLAEKQIDCPRVELSPSIANSPRREHFEKLLALGTKAPLEDFLQLWFPEHEGKELDSPFFACEEKEGGAFKFPGNFERAFSGDCRPDTLYSWGPRAKKGTIDETLADGNDWQGPINAKSMGKGGSLFASISAVSTYGFGSVLTRYKIKSDAPVVAGDVYDPIDRGVTVRTDNYHDFVIRNASAVESWSSGTPEIYDEVVRDIRRFRDGKRKSVYWEKPRLSKFDPVTSKYVDPEPAKPGIEDLFRQNADGYKTSELTLKQNLLELIREILAGEGKVSYAKDACRNRARHYATEHPNYINPFPLAVKPAK